MLNTGHHLAFYHMTTKFKLLLNAVYMIGLFMLHSIKERKRIHKVSSYTCFKFIDILVVRSARKCTVSSCLPYIIIVKDLLSITTNMYIVSGECEISLSASLFNTTKNSFAFTNQLPHTNVSLYWMFYRF